MASVGATSMASRAGARALANATSAPVRMPVQASTAVNSMGAGRLVVYSALTVSAISRTAPPARMRPRNTPSVAPATPKSSASARKSARMVERAAPMARRMPISARRRTTLTEIVL